MVCLSLDYKTDQAWYNSIRCWYYSVFSIISFGVIGRRREDALRRPRAREKGESTGVARRDALSC